MKVNGRNRELEGYTEDREYIHSKCDCDKCFWSDKKCNQKRLQMKNATEFGCEDYYPLDEGAGGTDYIDSVIDTGRDQYRKEYNDNYDEHMSEWN